MAWTPPPTPTPLNTDPEEILFLDIETVASFPSFNELPPEGKKAFIKKFANDIESVFEEHPLRGQVQVGSNLNDVWKNKAALHAEYNQIVCVSLGVIPKGEERTLRVKALFGEDEKKILEQLAPTLGKAKFLCAHNGKGFDFPLLARKYMQHGLDIPSIVSTWGLKPWETKHFDTREMWQFGNMRESVSLDGLAYFFGLPSPKQDMNGAQVGEVYYADPTAELPWEYSERLKKIADYCNGDVVTLVNAYLRMINKPIIPNDKLIFV
jgi:predicted PolB exonuclease-like 3'-5' exonuclease